MKDWAGTEEAEGKIRLTQCFQLIARIIACFIYKTDSQVQVRRRVMTCKAFTAIHSCAYLTSYFYCDNHFFHSFNKNQKTNIKSTKNQDYT